MMYRSERPDKGTIVYVGGLVDDVKKEELELEFEKFGKLNRVWVAFNPPGFAFVEFANKEDAESAVNAMHDTTVLGSKLRVEISRGRGRGSRGGSGRGGVDRGGRGGFRGGRGDFRGGRGGDFGGRGRGQGGFGMRPGPYDRDVGYKPFRGSDVGGRFEDYGGRPTRPEFADRDFGGPRDFIPRRDMGGGREYPDIDGPRGFGGGRDGERDFTPRDLGGRDYPPSGGGRDFPPRDLDGRDFVGRDHPREFGAREFGADRELNGARGYGAVDDLGPVERGYGGGRDLRGGFQNRDVPPGREIGGGRDFAPVREIGMRRESGGVRDFNPPRDIGNPREFGGRPARGDFSENDRFGGRGGFGDGEMRRAGGFDGGRYSAGDIGGSGDYGGYGARDRFRSRSPMGRGRLPY